MAINNSLYAFAKPRVNRVYAHWMIGGMTPAESKKSSRAVRNSPVAIRSPSTFKPPKNKFRGTGYLLEAIIPQTNRETNVIHVDTSSVSGAVVILPRATEQLQRIRSNLTHPVEFLAVGATPSATDSLVLKFFKHDVPPNFWNTGPHKVTLQAPYNIKEKRFVNKTGEIIVEASREFEIMRRLNSARPVTIGNRKFDVRQYVPKAFFLAYWPTLRVLGIGMSLSPGSSFYSLRRGEGLAASYVATIEKAFLSMWFQGVIHTDLHGGNLLVNPSTGQVSIIDFGRAMQLKPGAAAKVRAEFANAAKEGKVNSAALNPMPRKMTQILINTAAQRAVESRQRQVWGSEFWGNVDMLEYFVSLGCMAPTCDAAQLAVARAGPDGWIPSFRAKRRGSNMGAGSKRIKRNGM